MRLRGLPAGVLAGLFAASCGGDGGTVDPAPPPPAPTGTVIGQVTVEGAPLPGVLVSLTGTAAQSTATGADGGCDRDWRWAVGGSGAAWLPMC